MKVIIVSDTHYHNECLNELQNQYKDADYFVHCGDLEENADDYPGWLFVCGNCDYDPKLPQYRILDLEGNHRILVMHSHNCKMYRYQSLIHDALIHHCDIVCFGHTHVAEVQREQNITLINPGSIWFSRSKSPGSYAVLEIINKKIKVEIVYNDGKKEWFTKD